MEHVIYADILIFLNTVVTFILLLTVKDVSKAETSAGRLAVGSVVGGLYSLIILAPPMSLFPMLLTRTFMAASLVLIVFRFREVRKFVRLLLVFLAATFLLAGIAFGLSAIIPGSAVRFNNGYGYARLSAGALTVITAVVYFCVRLLRKRFFAAAQGDFIYDVEIRRGEKVLKCRALYDSGNSLTDVYTGKPVVIVGTDGAAALLNGKELEELTPAFSGLPACDGRLKLRLLPAGTVAGEKLLPAFTVNEATVERDGKTYTVREPTLAVTENGFENEKYTALINEAVFR